MIPVSQSAVFDFVGDSRNAPRWVWGISDVDAAAPHPLRPGDEVTFQLGAKGRILESRWRIEEWVPPVRVTSTGHALGAQARLRIECRALGPGQTQVEEVLQYRLPGGPLGLVADRLGIHGILEMQARNSMRRLHRVLTTGLNDRSPARPRRARGPRRRAATGEGADGR